MTGQEFDVIYRDWLFGELSQSPDQELLASLEARLDAELLQTLRSRPPLLRKVPDGLFLTLKRRPDAAEFPAPLVFSGLPPSHAGKL